jgi:hypothetical protein
VVCSYAKCDVADAADHNRGWGSWNGFSSQGASSMRWWHPSNVVRDWVESDFPMCSACIHDGTPGSHRRDHRGTHGRRASRESSGRVAQARTTSRSTGLTRSSGRDVAAADASWDPPAIADVALRRRPSGDRGGRGMSWPDKASTATGQPRLGWAPVRTRPLLERRLRSSGPSATIAVLFPSAEGPLPLGLDERKRKPNGPVLNAQRGAWAQRVGRPSTNRSPLQRKGYLT